MNGTGYLQPFSPGKDTIYRSLVGDGLHDRSRGPLVERIQDFHVLPADIEIEDIGITSNSLRVVGLGQRYPPLLQSVADQHLLRRPVVLLRHLHQGWVISFIVAHNWRVGFNNDAVLLAVCVDFALLAPWVKLWVEPVSRRHSNKQERYEAGEKKKAGYHTSI